MSKNTPDPVDVHVGAAIRRERTLRGMSQTALGDAAGITFQQIQKYEKGSNRISASMMWKFCQVLDIQPGELFEGLKANGTAKKGAAPLVNREVLEFARSFGAIKGRKSRDAVRDLVKSLAA